MGLGMNLVACVVIFFLLITKVPFHDNAFSALTLLVGHQGEPPVIGQ